MPADSDAAKALDLIHQSGFTTDANWVAAHEIAQNHEGEQVFDAIHALLHRIEGDIPNTGYWDRRAGTNLGDAGFKAELDAIRKLSNDA